MLGSEKLDLELQSSYLF